MHKAIRYGSMPALLLCFSFAAASQADPGVPVVEVQGAATGRDQKSYRDMVAGMQVFEQQRALAPGATLRFKVLPRQAGVAMDRLALQLAGEHTQLPIALAADHTFVLPMDAGAAGENASVRSNRKEKSLAWRADIRTPGLPQDTRRLGDLLLECKVAMAADLLAYVHHPINMLVVKLADPCSTLPINVFYFADRPLFSVTLIDGQRRSVLPAAMLHGTDSPLMASHEDWPYLRDRVYTVRFKLLYGKGWSDDTLLRFDYMDDDLATTAPAVQP